MPFFTRKRPRKQSTGIGGIDLLDCHDSRFRKDRFSMLILTSSRALVKTYLLAYWQKEHFVNLLGDDGQFF